MKREAFAVFVVVLFFIPLAQARLLIKEPVPDKVFVRGEEIGINVDFSLGGKMVSGANVRAITPVGIIPMRETTEGYTGSYRTGFGDPVGNWTIRVVGTGQVEEEDTVTIAMRKAQLKVEITSPSLEDEEKGDVEAIILYPNGEIARGLKVNVTDTSARNLVESGGRYLGVYSQKKDFNLKVEAEDRHGNYGFSILSVKVIRKGLLDVLRENAIFLVPLGVLFPIAFFVLLSNYQKTLRQKLEKRGKGVEERKKDIQIQYFKGKMPKNQFETLMKEQEAEQEKLKESLEVSKKRRLILRGLLRKYLSR